MTCVNFMLVFFKNNLNFITICNFRFFLNFRIFETLMVKCSFNSAGFFYVVSVNKDFADALELDDTYRFL